MTRFSLTIAILLVVGVCFNATTSDSVCQLRCPDFWTQVGSSCYKFYRSLTTWHSAQQTCIGLEADLPSIHNYQESQVLFSLWQQQGSPLSDTLSAYWIGLHDSHSEGRFQWTDGTSTDFLFWDTAQPDNFKSGEDCGHVHHRGNNDHDKQRWNDITCNSRMTFFCVKAATTD